MTAIIPAAPTGTRTPTTDRQAENEAELTRTTTWSELPLPVRVVVEDHAGTVVDATKITTGRGSDVATVLRTDTGKSLFLKGVRGVSPRMRWLRNEVAAGAITEGIAPAIRFAQDVDDWLVVGFEYLPGRAAGLAPGSPDLPSVAEIVARIAAIPATGLRPLSDRWSGIDWWSTLAEQNSAVVDGWDVEEMRSRASLIPELTRGTSLVHTDLHGDQFVLGEDGSVHVIDWGLPGAGASWVDPAFLVLRLIEAGHRPSDAERWALSLPGFANVDHATVLDAFSAYLAGMWSCWAANDKPAPGAVHRAELARDYASWRRITRTVGG